VREPNEGEPGAPGNVPEMSSISQKEGVNIQAIEKRRHGTTFPSHSIRMLRGVLSEKNA
jgi:hypothetical protein